MSRGSVDMNFLFTLGELQRLMRAYADKQAARYGITRAQWAVLAKVERTEGLKQSELAEQMEMQPITLTRLIDRLCDNGWIERRSDDSDRRVNRLYFRKAKPVLLEPIMKVEVVTPEDYTGSVIGDLNSRRGQIQGQDMRGNANVINAMVPLMNMFGYVNNLRSMSQGRATFTMQFDHYAEAPANVSAEVQKKFA
jgi:hypothetical protein